jgi:small nuclear ribonucleoprotein (snRNP)-like protein
MLRYHGPTNELGWLESAVDEPVEVVLESGETVAGVLRGSDEHAILVETSTERPTTLIYKRGICLIRR